MKNIAVFGSTGSIGKSTLSVIRRLSNRFKVVSLSTNSDIKTLNQQIREFRPLSVCVRDKEAALKLKRGLRFKVKIFAGDEGLAELAEERIISQFVFAISGSAALAPLLSAIKMNKDIALANKEALVMAGPLIMGMAKKAKVRIIPVDSEQSAIWQCLEGQERQKLKTIYLTASGGPLFNEGKAASRSIPISRVLKHPRWKMGKKITVDSATLMNKGLEFLEAMFLFNVGPDKIKILIHPEALIHSMVEFIDGVVLAQLSVTDMRIPIQYALSYPERLDSSLPGLDFYKLKSLNFRRPDILRFPCLGLAYQAAKELGTLPAVMNAANEIAVEGFLKERLSFIKIPVVVARVMRKHRNKLSPGLNDIREADSWARHEAHRFIN
ncbi:MAG: 1-deoxy-D-xylulose-5-phosphate reductoisomerase [Candidatus Omnitrophota bacterium]|jgi:1-deoxy-D-xylulose-5-phosphate reductoisomerase